MFRPLRGLLPLLLLVLAPALRAAVDTTAFDRALADATKAGSVTVVHLWAPWCPNCKNELKDRKWADFIAAHPKVDFVFVTVWNDQDGREVLAANGVGDEPNFRLLLHPNGSRRGDRLTSLLGLPVSWIPTTWIFQRGQVRYALNYGELRFGMLDQLLADTAGEW
jgi:thiol-disulfide isomerase/thioredoxin